IFFSAFIFNTPQEILYGLNKIIHSPSILLTDYIEVSNLGSTFFNSGLLMILFVCMTKLSKTSINGPMIAGILTIGGFAFFGKNIFNVWPIVFGVYLNAKINKDLFKDYIVVAMFATALAPLVSQVSFGFGLNIYLGVTLGIVCGIIAGFILPPLSKHFINFHQGFNLYNIGFTAGMIATMFMAIFRVLGFDNTSQAILSSNYNGLMFKYFSLYFISMVVLGFVLNNKSLKNLNTIMNQSGVLSSDFVAIGGFGVSLLNMGLLGLMSILYVCLVKGDFNGPVIGALLTVSGFGAFGKHLKNTVFVITGVYLVTIFTSLDAGSTGVLIAALFGTALAPISGKFGWPYGILAGMVHISLVLHTAYLHGGMNLYNNGFTAGLVAAFLVPLIQTYKTKKIK
ncbi:MAG TPA: DUF1576 domain-containing protein, partial [Erysipelotrichaceae bacterium]|nr:DUF1576 domain-containing protein [Erysipelotrichaceae bacterium]